MSNTSSNQHEWEIGLSAWIIQDGNYPDFEAGQPAEFALEFSSDSFGIGRPGLRIAKPLGEAKYEINSQVVYLASDVWVIDFGILAFQQSAPPKNLSVGDFVAAEIYLGIDPFFYFERLNRQPGIPLLIYSWKVKSIRQITGPHVETRDASGLRILVRDKIKQDCKPLLVTDAWNDDGGNGEYLLGCELLEVPPKFNRATAT
jgi:hypothetical protein